MVVTSNCNKLHLKSNLPNTGHNKLWPWWRLWGRHIVTAQQQARHLLIIKAVNVKNNSVGFNKRPHSNKNKPHLLQFLDFV